MFEDFECVTENNVTVVIREDSSEYKFNGCTSAAAAAFAAARFDDTLPAFV